MIRCPSPDRYTHCAPKNMEQRRRNSVNGSIHTSRMDILRQLSISISIQENRISNLMHSFDIHEEHGNSCKIFDGRTAIEQNKLLSPLSTSRPSQPSSPNSPRRVHGDDLNKRRPTSHPPLDPRPGRLSPRTIQMILSPNTSTLSEVSSGADTSYDSGLYHWLGLKNSASDSEILPDSRFVSTEQFDPDVSNWSSQSAYSQPSPFSSASNRNLLPLSPPATVRPSFSESLSRGDREAPSDFIPNLDSDWRFSGDNPDQAFLHDFIIPMLLKNISLQHHMPSTTVLRHFQRVVDELRELYVPNDKGNNVPKHGWKEKSTHFIRKTITSTHPFPGSHHPPASVSFLRDRSHTAELPLHSRAYSPPKVLDEESRATRELYTEMAVMLFKQAAEDEAQVTDLRCLTDQFEILARKKREIALVVGMRGKERP